MSSVHSYTVGYAAMNVRPSLLSIYETHFVPLGRHVKPALTGLLLGLLPGLEEGSDHFDRYVTGALTDLLLGLLPGLEEGSDHFDRYVTSARRQHARVCISLESNTASLEYNNSPTLPLDI